MDYVLFSYLILCFSWHLPGWDMTAGQVLVGDFISDCDWLFMLVLSLLWCLQLFLSITVSVYVFSLCLTSDRLWAHLVFNSVILGWVDWVCFVMSSSCLYYYCYYIRKLFIIKADACRCVFVVFEEWLWANVTWNVRWWCVRGTTMNDCLWSVLQWCSTCVGCLSLLWGSLLHLLLHTVCVCVLSAWFSLFLTKST